MLKFFEQFSVEDLAGEDINVENGSLLEKSSIEEYVSNSISDKHLMKNKTLMEETSLGKFSENILPVGEQCIEENSIKFEIEALIEIKAF